MAVKEFRLPDLGEGLTESELVAWKVAVGDTVRLNQIIAEVETAKALVELPAPYEGTVSRLYVEPGVTVAVGEPIVAFEVAGEAAPTEPAVPAEPAAPPAAEESAADAPQPNLVGYGARAESSARPQRRARPGLAGLAAAAPAATAVAESARTQPAPAPTRARGERPLAAPPVRMLARDRGVDLATVRGTGERGLITRQDVENARTPASRSASSPQGTVPGAGGEDVRIPVRGVRKATADAMVRSAFTAPQATVFLTVDATPTMELVDRLRSRSEFADSRPGFLAVVSKALCLAVRRTPEVNARWDDDAQEIMQFGAVSLGIAAATPRGLMVPTIPGASALTLAELAQGIRQLAETARAGRTPPERLTGSTITITNVGVFGVDAGTPILTPGEAAILAVGAVRRQPWEHDGGIALRQVVTFALTFDHRVVDGEQAARFLADIGRIIADPAAVLTMV